MPPVFHAKSQLKSAVRAVPICKAPVGLGAILTLTFPSIDCWDTPLDAKLVDRVQRFSFSGGDDLLKELQARAQGHKP